MHFSLVVRFVSQKFFQQFYVSLRILSRVFAFEAFHIILNRSIVGSKSFLARVFKFKRKVNSTLARDFKSESLDENHLVTAHTSKNMIRGT